MFYSRSFRKRERLGLLGLGPLEGFLPPTLEDEILAADDDFLVGIANCLKRDRSSTMCDQSFACQRDGMAIGPRSTRAGNYICLFLGFRTPFVIRAIDEDCWLLIGECYIEGIMNGQVVDNIDWTKVDNEVPNLPLQDFRIY